MSETCDAIILPSSPQHSISFVLLIISSGARLLTNVVQVRSMAASKEGLEVGDVATAFVSPSGDNYYELGNKGRR